MHMQSAAFPFSYLTAEETSAISSDKGLYENPHPTPPIHVGFRKAADYGRRTWKNRRPEDGGDLIRSIQNELKIRRARSAARRLIEEEDFEEENQIKVPSSSYAKGKDGDDHSRRTDGRPPQIRLNNRTINRRSTRRRSSRPFRGGQKTTAMHAGGAGKNIKRPAPGVPSVQPSNQESRLFFNERLISVGVSNSFKGVVIKRPSDTDSGCASDLSGNGPSKRNESRKSSKEVLQAHRDQGLRPISMEHPGIFDNFVLKSKPNSFSAAAEDHSTLFDPTGTVYKMLPSDIRRDKLLRIPINFPMVDSTSDLYLQPVDRRNDEWNNSQQVNDDEFHRFNYNNNQFNYGYLNDEMNDNRQNDIQLNPHDGVVINDGLSNNNITNKRNNIQAPPSGGGIIPRQTPIQVSIATPTFDTLQQDNMQTRRRRKRTLEELDGCFRCTRSCRIAVVISLIVISLLLFGAGFVSGWFAHQMSHR